MSDHLIDFIVTAAGNYSRWELVENADHLDWSEIAYVGYGFVLLCDGSRLDMKPDLFEADRRAWHHIQNTSIGPCDLCPELA